MERKRGGGEWVGWKERGGKRVGEGEHVLQPKNRFVSIEFHFFWKSGNKRFSIKGFSRLEQSYLTRKKRKRKKKISLKPSAQK